MDVTGVKVFSATKAKERELLGEVITDWIRAHQDVVAGRAVDDRHNASPCRGVA